MEQQREVEITASSREYEAFMTGRVWKDIAFELGEWINKLVQGLSEEEGTELYRYQGRKDALENVLRLPIILLEEARIREERALNGER